MRLNSTVPGRGQKPPKLAKGLQKQKGGKEGRGNKKVGESFVRWVTLTKKDKGKAGWKGRESGRVDSRTSHSRISNPKKEKRKSMRERKRQLTEGLVDCLLRGK